MATAAGNYIDEDDIDNWSESATTADKQVVIDLVEQIIEKVTKDYFYVADFDITLDGNGKDRLYLNLMPDILSLTSIAVSGITLNTSSYTHDKHFVYIDDDATFDIELRYLQKSTGIFPRGIGNINVVGTYGWETCPEAIKKAAIILARHENDGTLYTPMKGIKSYTTGRMSVTYADVLKGKSSGVLEADQLLKLYITKKPLLRMI